MQEDLSLLVHKMFALNNSSDFVVPLYRTASNNVF